MFGGSRFMHPPHITHRSDIPGHPTGLDWPPSMRRPPRRRLHRVRRIGSVLTTVVEGLVAAVVGFTAGVLIMSLVAPGDALPWRQELSDPARQEAPAPTLLMLEDGEDPAVLDRELRELEQERAPAGEPEPKTSSNW
jgi:hypothetical protein